MVTYLPAIIWIIGAVISYVIARKRGVKITLLKNIFIALLGPLSIPFSFFFKTEKIDKG